MEMLARELPLSAWEGHVSSWKSHMSVHCDDLLSALAFSYLSSCQATIFFQSISLRRLDKCLRRYSIGLRETSVDLRGPCAGRLK